jgi:hypothetical protein
MSFESEIAHQFAPTYHASRNERNYLVQLESEPEPRLALAHPYWRPYVYFSVLDLGVSDTERAYEINYLTIWDWDRGVLGGVGAHQWDTERTAVLVVGPERSRNAQQYVARQAYYAAHEGVRIGLWSLDNSRYYRYRAKRPVGPEVYWSDGKHASFPDLSELTSSTAQDTYAKPGEIVRPGEYVLADAGTLTQPSPDAPWISYEKGWGPNGIAPLRDKLKERLWDAAGNPLRRIPTLTEREIEQAQVRLGVPRTGQFDQRTLREAAARLPAQMVWTTGKIKRSDIKLMAERGFDVSELQ